MIVLVTIIYARRTMLDGSEAHIGIAERQCALADLRRDSRCRLISSTW